MIKGIYQIGIVTGAFLFNGSCDGHRQAEEIPEIGRSNDPAPQLERHTTPPAGERQSELRAAIKSRFQSWNPALDTVTSLEDGELFSDVATTNSEPAITYALARAIRGDFEHQDSFSDEAYGVFTIDPGRQRITETLGFIPTCRWNDCLGEILVAWEDSVAITLGGATYGDAGDTIVIQRFGPSDLSITTTRFGPVNKTTSEADLIALFGSSAVTREDLYLGEGICAPGTVLFPNHPNRLEVMWKDSNYAEPVTVRTRKEGSDWHTPDGVHIGITLTALEEMANEPVGFAGFDWDYGGRTGWPVDSGSIGLQLRYDHDDMRAAAQHPRFRETQGDREVRSNHPALQNVRIWVFGMFLNWGYPADTHDCA